MTGTTRNWDDLSTRISTGALLVVVGIAAIWLGGAVFLALAALAGAVMVWELARMLSPRQPQLAVVLGLCALIWAVVFYRSWMVIGIGSLLLVSLVGAAFLDRGRVIFAGYGIAIVIACFSLAVIRHDQGPVELLWLVCVVIASDVGGYFAGRTLGGPKFWPAVSPKKTWTGTVAGWICALWVGVGFAVFAGFEPIAVLLSGLMALAAQLGDIVESAIKRKSGVKDSSNLLPGHGGLLDRFDAMIGAAVFFLLVVAPVSIWWPIQ